LIDNVITPITIADHDHGDAERLQRARHFVEQERGNHDRE
jgi:hypothetical protein